MAEFVVGSALGLVTGFVEKKAVPIIGRRENKDSLLRIAEQVLAGKGLFARLDDFNSWRESPVRPHRGKTVKEVKEGKLELFTALEDELLDATAGYLKTLLKESCEGRG